MLDIKWIRDHPEKLDEALQKRGLVSCSGILLELDQKRRTLQTGLQELQNERNQIAKSIAQARAMKNNEEAQKLSEKSSNIKITLVRLEEEEKKLSDTLTYRLATLPNIPRPEVPVGRKESENIEVIKWGVPPSFNFSPKAHLDLGENLGLMDFQMAAGMSGARFVLLRGLLAQLERALAQFMLAIHTQEFGYEEISPPLLVRDEAFYGVGLLPKFSDNAFQTTNGHWLIPTAEVSLTNMVRDQVLEDDQLPLRSVAHTPCFRSEAGAAGRDTRGMVRQHQFYKVELVSIVRPEQAKEEHERMVNCAETILQRLKLPYRKVLLCTGDMGIQSEKTYDLEIWLPAENTYREISSCSSCGDYQARRLKARFKDHGSDAPLKTRFVNTLNGSGVAVGRALVAVMENYQQQDGTIEIPEVLRSYMNDQTHIKKKVTR